MLSGDTLRQATSLEMKEIRSESLALPSRHSVFLAKNPSESAILHIPPWWRLTWSTRWQVLLVK